MSKFLKELLDKYDFNQSDIKRVKDKFKDIKNRSKIKSIEFFIDHEPIPSKRPRKGKYSFYVPDAAKNKKAIRELIKDQIPDGFKKIQTEVYISTKCYLPMLEGFSKTDKYLAEKGIIRPTTKPDVDNLEKTYLDALNDYIWDDDGQIVDGRTQKFYSVHPRVEITIKYRNIFLSALLEGYVRNRLKNKEAKQNKPKQAKPKKGGKKNGGK
jgi:Holliday junction resolvase RusA-like endonuclease